MDLKWTLAIACEVVFWALFVLFGLLRYRFGLDRASIFVLVAIVLDHVALLALGVWDYVDSGHVSTFTVVIVGLLLYALTLGKRDMKRVDAWATRRFSPRSRVRPEAAPAPPRRS